MCSSSLIYVILQHLLVALNIMSLEELLYYYLIVLNFFTSTTVYIVFLLSLLFSAAM